MDGIDLNQIQCPQSMLFDEVEDCYEADDKYYHAEQDAPVKEITSSRVKATRRIITSWILKLLLVTMIVMTKTTLYDIAIPMPTPLNINTAPNPRRGQSFARPNPSTSFDASNQ